jgi:glutathione S-transferase
MNWESALQAQAYLAGPRWGLLDVCVAPFVRQFARTDRAWFEAQAWPQLCQWLRAFENSSAFEKVMGKHPVWSPPEA